MWPIYSNGLGLKFKQFKWRVKKYPIEINGN